MNTEKKTELKMISFIISVIRIAGIFLIFVAIASLIKSSDSDWEEPMILGLLYLIIASVEELV